MGYGIQYRDDVHVSKETKTECERHKNKIQVTPCQLEIVNKDNDRHFFPSQYRYFCTIILSHEQDNQIDE